MIVLLVWIVILGLIVGAVYRWAPIPNGFKLLVYIVCIVLALFLVLHFFGINLGTSLPTRG